MRRSFGGASGGMGGGSGGGGGMLRSVHRAVRAGIGGAPTEPFSRFPESGGVGGSANSKNCTNAYKKESISPNNNLNLSSSSYSGGAVGVGSGRANDKNSNYSKNSIGSAAFSSLICLPPLSAAAGAASQMNCPSPATRSEYDSDWEYVDGGEDEMSRVFYEDFVFESVPTIDEVQHAVTSLQQVVEQTPIGSSKQVLVKNAGNVHNEVTFPMGIEEAKSSDNTAYIDWSEPSMNCCDSRMSFTPHGSDRVYDAFHLLQTEPSVQRMVVSLSSDKSVWDAVMNNDAVKELRSTISQDADKLRESPDEKSNNDSNPMKDIFSWIFVNAESKILQFIDKIAKLLAGFFVPGNTEEKEGIAACVEEKVKASLFLSIIVLLIVVITRVQNA